MANMLIRVGVALIVFIYSFNTIGKAESENFKQCFYMIKEDTNSKDLSHDLRTLDKLKIPIFIVIDPNQKIGKEVIEVIEKTQKKTNLHVLLEDGNNLEKSYFKVKSFDKNIKLSGLFRIEKDELTYMGKRNTSFEIMQVEANPLEAMLKIKKKKNQKLNHALIIDGQISNLSTLTLAYNELNGVGLDTKGYRFSFEKVGMRYEVFISVGEVTIILFSTSIVILSIAIIVLRKWSKEKFLS